MTKVAATRRPARLLAAAAAAIFAPAFASEALAKKAVVNLEPAAATEVDLTGANASVNVGGVIFENTDTQPTGTGVIRSFVRLQSPGNATTENGHNTDDRPLENDENNSPQFTRSLLLSDLAVFDVGGTDYYKFLLDLNEPGGNKATISLDDVEFYQSDTATLNGYNETTKFGSDATLVYNLDAGMDRYLKLVEDGSGSGSGDLFAYVPTSIFGGAGDYLYLYSAFGGKFAAEGGFEEWAAVTGGRDNPPPTAIPLPPAAWTGLATLGLALGGSSYRRLRARRLQTA